MAKSFTGRGGRTTPKSVKTAERTAHVFIALGGVGTIVAVSLIFFFLLWVVAPLFTGAELEEKQALPAATAAGEIVASGVDQFRRMGWVLTRDGAIRSFRLDDGTTVRELRLFDDAPTDIAFAPDGQRCAFAYADGSIQTGWIGFSEEFLEPDAMPADLRGLEQGAVAPYRDGLVELTSAGQFRFQLLVVRLDAPLQAADRAIAMLDYSITPSASEYGVLFEDGTLSIFRETEKENLLTGEITRSLRETRLPYEKPPGRGRPRFLRLSGIGTHLHLIWEDGLLVRYSTADASNPVEAETVKLLPEGGRVTVAQYLIGKTTLMVGDDRGALRAWFPTRPEDAGTVDNTVLQCGHVLEGAGSPVTALTPSTRTRLLAAGHADGSVRVHYVTSEKLLAETRVDAPVRAIAVAPREDGLLVLTPGGMRTWDMDPGFPEASPGALFLPVWYEGYPEPQSVWQSTGGTDDFEPKLGLWPLVFGTLKATLYSILIAAPIALLAAVFTSEFLEPRLKAPIKSTIEMMASLPSVVLGFLAALVIAPFVQDVVPATLVAFLAVPLVFLLGARLWQFLPTRLAIRWGGLPRASVILVGLAAGIGLASALGPWFERAYFAGDIKRWLSDDEYGSPMGGWAFLLLPLCLVGLGLALAATAGPWIRSASVVWSRRQCAAFDLGRYLALLVAALALSWAFAWLFTVLGFDPRGGIFGTYAQRNALIVGFAMGFAVIPIIYTLAEDALTSVPQALREGSLGAGATPWQTAYRIVIPAAMSGLFGALMVGLGRAVGETMIVLMAAGNTPILDWNMFSGFRTLAANIAVELPEAVKDSTHYRTLFLAAFVLFLMTFVINMFAELVRRRFRKRFAEL